MKKNAKNEELQSRREFFKKAAKGALPILGAIALASIPGISNAMSTGACTCASCVGGCGTACFQNCAANCHIGCGRYCSRGANKG